MTLQSDITTIQDTIDDIETAIINKGGTISGGLSTFASAINNLDIPIGINREVVNGVYRTPTTSFTFSLPSNATTIDSTVLYYAFSGSTGLTSVDLGSLTTITGDSSLSSAFGYCSNLTSVNLSSLTSINSNRCFFYTFQSCTSLTTLSFPSLTSTSFGSITTQFSYMLSGVTGCTVHFPSNLQSVIGSWSDVTNGFGGTNTTVLFDLPATT